MRDISDDRADRFDRHAEAAGVQRQLAPDGYAGDAHEIQKQLQIR